MVVAEKQTVHGARKPAGARERAGKAALDPQQHQRRAVLQTLTDSRLKKTFIIHRLPYVVYPTTQYVSRIT